MTVGLTSCQTARLTAITTTLTTATRTISTVVTAEDPWIHQSLICRQSVSGIDQQQLLDKQLRFVRYLLPSRGIEIVVCFLDLLEEHFLREGKATTQHDVRDDTYTPHVSLKRIHTLLLNGVLALQDFRSKVLRSTAIALKA